MLQTLGPELQALLELLDSPDRQRQLGLAEVHVSLATLEEVFLTVVKQVSSMSSNAMQWHCKYGATPCFAHTHSCPPVMHRGVTHGYHT